MITLHHLNKSRSKRIIWLLEELGVEYEIVSYQRDKDSFLAPASLKKIHALGKSPVLEDNGQMIAESGAITEYLITRYGNGKLAPQRDSKEYIEYIQWLHFAESSAILPLLMKMFLQKDGCETRFLNTYVDIETEKVISYFNASLEGKTYLVGERLSGADIMMSFIVEILSNSLTLDNFEHIKRYDALLKTHASFNKADLLEAQNSTL
ncbi:glutathione S-transferase domain-containing protein [Psychromonas sp. CNPT3]|uniref:glutathione S-transferase family protein n=1 Tax=Psychromonas sp. CNPT3 TaxID=314282 RepID=UPI00006E9E2A|nr:glutathione S-transferase [Psychromonas sp. CNPT3]AGH80927.1 glutathione S-transferase domain-containing protein [Psychromonas sp. CNPT3]